MKILFVYEYYHPHVGGAEVLLQSLAEGLVELGHECKVVTLKLSNTKSYELLNGVEIYRVKAFNRTLFTFLSLPKIIRLASECDIIHTFTYNAAFPAFIAARLLGKHCVITVHEVLNELWKELGLIGGVYSLLERLILKLPFDAFVAPSIYTKRRIPKKAFVVYPGVDEKFKPLKSDFKSKLGLEGCFLCLAYGRPGFTKGFEYLVRAVQHVDIERFKLLLLLAREPALGYRKILELVKDLELERKILILEEIPREELPKLVAACDCVVVPSLSEGFGFTAAESCAMGKIVLASRTGALPEVVSGKYVFFEPRNDRAIARAISKAYRGEIERRGKRRFSIERMAEEYLDIYTSILKQRSSV